MSEKGMGWANSPLRSPRKSGRGVIAGLLALCLMLPAGVAAADPDDASPSDGNTSQMVDVSTSADEVVSSDENDVSSSGLVLPDDEVAASTDGTAPTLVAPFNATTDDSGVPDSAANHVSENVPAEGDGESAATGSISGTVTDEDGTPLEGADVVLDGMAGSNEAKRTSTDVLGRYVFGDLPEGDYYTVSATTAGYEWSYYVHEDGLNPRGVGEPVGVHGDVTGIDMTLKRAVPVPQASISGQVRDHSGNPVAGVTVEATSDSNAYWGSGTTDSDGRYSFSGAAGTRIHVKAVKFESEGERRQRGSYDGGNPVLADGDLKNIDIVVAFPSLHSICGNVRDESGAFIEGVRVSADGTTEDSTSGRTETTGSAGEYCLEDLEKGSYTISASSVAGEGWFGVHSNDPEQSSTLVVIDDADVVGADILVKPGVRLSGTLRYEDGSVLPEGRSIELLFYDGDVVDWPSSSWTEVGPDGHYEVTAVPPGRYSRLQFWDFDSDEDDRLAPEGWYGGMDYRSASEIIVPTGGLTGIDVTFYQRQAEITGRVDADVAKPAFKYTSMSAYRWEGSSWTKTRSVSGWGNYRLRDLPAGTYTVGFEDPEFDGIDYPYCPQFWNGKDSLEAAETFEIAAGASKSGINATLTKDCSSKSIIPGEVTISGNGTVGETLTANPGTWQPEMVELAYQWKADSLAVEGATAATLDVTPDLVGKKITVQVTGTRPNYTPANGESDPVTIGAADLTPATPSIVGTAQVGSLLTAVPGVWTPEDVTLTYQWFADGKAVTGATGVTFVPGTEHEGSQIQVSVTGNKAGYNTASRVSDPLGPLAAAPLAELQAGTPTINGIAQVGETLTVDPGAWGPDPVNLTYRWYVDGEGVVGATGSSFAPAPQHEGKTVSVVVRGEKEGYEPASRTAVALVPVARATPEVTLDKPSVRHNEELTISVKNARPNEELSIELGSGQKLGDVTADAQGNTVVTLVISPEVPIGENSIKVIGPDTALEIVVSILESAEPEPLDPQTVTPVVPEISENTVTIPEVKGIVYKVGGHPVTGVIDLNEQTRSLTVVAEPEEGYVFSSDAVFEWVFEYIPSKDPSEPGTAEPTDPSTSDPSEPGTAEPTQPGTEPTGPEVSQPGNNASGSTHNAGSQNGNSPTNGAASTGANQSALPNTGADVFGMALVAMMLVGVGGFVLVNRRRQLSLLSE